MSDAQTLEGWERLQTLAQTDPEQLRSVILSVFVHVCLTLGFLAIVVIAERRFKKRVPWPAASLGAMAVCLVLALELVAHGVSGEGGLRAMSWFFGMAIGVPAAVLIGWLTTWWMVKHSGLSSTAWCVAMAALYLPLITNYGLSHF